MPRRKHEQQTRLFEHDTPAKPAGPVECLGMTFENDDARRKYFVDKLREKLKNPEFRKIEGFPIGSDEDILALSDPPYYTACPNPWLGEFVKCYGKPYDPAVPYSREPFAVDVSEGKTDPLYKAHSYHTKVPHLAIVPSILHYTEPGDIVLDGFCGSGMTGVAGQWCGSAPEDYRRALEARRQKQGLGKPQWGARRVILNDLSPAATFIAANYNLPFDVAAFADAGKALLDELDVPRRDSDMSFSVSCAQTGLEYNGHSPDTLFAQRRNLLRPSFWRLLAEIRRFFREGTESLAAGGGADPWEGRFEQAALPPGPAGGLAAASAPRPARESPTLGEFLARGGYGRDFREQFVLPMAAAIWSLPAARSAELPADWFLRFFGNHGMLAVDGRPTWKVIAGGSRTYVERLLARRPGRLHLSTPVARIFRHSAGVELVTAAGQHSTHARVVLACHADQALRLLAAPNAAERDVLGALRTQPNSAVLHRDARLMPRARRAWAAWNVRRAAPSSGSRPDDERPVAITYWMNRLQGLPTATPVLVTLNRDEEIRPELVWRRLAWRHPVFSAQAVAAQRRWSEIDGLQRTHYCGAWWGWGFHEDGVKSALAVARRFGVHWPAQAIEPLAAAAPDALHAEARP